MKFCHYVFVEIVSFFCLVSSGFAFFGPWSLVFELAFCQREGGEKGEEGEKEGRWTQAVLVFFQWTWV